MGLRVVGVYGSPRKGGNNADIIILSSPVFFYGLSSQLKALIDRAQAMWSRKRLKGLATGLQEIRGRGYLLAVGATTGERLFQGPQMVAMKAAGAE
jgi:arsenate reductase (thioredoxin)